MLDPCMSELVIAATSVGTGLPELGENESNSWYSAEDEEVVFGLV